MKPQDVELHNVDTSRGSWGIFVQSVAKAQDNDNLFLTTVLEQNIDDEHIDSRRLKLLVFSPELASDAGRKGILREIRSWIDTTEGDGSLDLVSKSI
jgi:hypothetical protein